MCSVSIFDFLYFSPAFVFVVVVIRLLASDGGMAEHHGALEAGQPPGPGPEVVERQSRQRVSGVKSP